MSRIAVARAFVTAWLRVRRLRTRAQIERFHDRAVRRLLARVAPRSAHTRARLALAADWRDVPPIDKAEMMAAFDELVTERLTRDEALARALAAEESRDFASEVRGLTVGLSSGTSGRRGLFLLSAAERAGWAGTILARMIPDLLVRRHRVAFFLRANSALYETIGSRRVSFRYFDLERPLAAHLDELRAFAPTIVVAPPSVLRALAERVADLRPRRVVAVAEVLDEIDERVIRGAFAVRVEQIYQATEGLLGVTCAAGTLHLCEDVNAFTLVPVRGDPRRVVPIVTNLFRTTQPIVRYRLDDVLVLREEPCPCGSPFVGLARVEGREGDVLRGRGPRGEVPVFADLVSRAILRAIDPADYEVAQSATGALTVSLALPAGLPTDEERERVATALRALFVRQGADPPAVTVVPLTEALAPTVKRRRIHR